MRKVYSLAAVMALLVASAHAAGPPEETERGGDESSAASAERRASSLLRAELLRSELKGDLVLFSSPTAHVTPDYTSMLPVGRRGSKVPVQNVKVERGRADVLVPEGAPERGVMLEGPAKVMAISTLGRLSMVVTDQAVTVVALRGEALVGADSRFRPLLAGEYRSFDAKTGASLEQGVLPEAPQLSTPSSLAPRVGGPATMSVRSRGEQPLRAVVMDRDGNPVGPVLSATAGQALFIPLPNAGSYQVVARAIGPAGIAGPLSEPLALQALGVGPGQHQELKGVFLLGPEERLQLVGTLGLEMRYGVKGPFVPAVTSLGLPTDEPTLVQFRDPDAPTQIALVRLAPKIADADVIMGPGLAKWPKDPVHMQVRLRDGTGRPISLDDRFDISTRINLDEVEVDWTPTQNGVEATLQPRSGRGPWVIRVVVTDEHEREVGRGHLEVIREPVRLPKTARR